MTNTQKIINKLAEYHDAGAAYNANPTAEGWRAFRAVNDSLIPFAKNHPISRAEYESLLSDAGCRTDNTDNAIYRHDNTWWIGDHQWMWALAHYARQAQLIIERGQYIPPTAEMMGLELVDDGLPSGFREYHRANEN